FAEIDACLITELGDSRISCLIAKRQCSEATDRSELIGLGVAVHTDVLQDDTEQRSMGYLRPGRRRGGRFHWHADWRRAERNREIIAELGGKRRVGSACRTRIRLLGDSDRYNAVHVVVQSAIGANRAAPPATGCVGAVKAPGDFGLPEVAAEIEALRSLAP